jgi:hypothetical protein
MPISSRFALSREDSYLLIRSKGRESSHAKKSAVYTGAYKAADDLPFKPKGNLV